MSQVPTSSWSPSQQTLTLRMARTEGKKEAETYENIFEYLIKGCYPHYASKADKSVLRRMSKKFQLVDGILHYKGKGQLRHVNYRLLSWKVVGFSFSVVDFVHQIVEEACGGLHVLEGILNGKYT